MFYFTFKAQFMWHQKQHSTSLALERFTNFFQSFYLHLLWLFCISVSSVFFLLVWGRSWQPGTNVVRHFNRPCDIFELLERDITNSQFKGGEDLPRHLSLGASLLRSLSHHVRTTPPREKIKWGSNQLQNISFSDVSPAAVMWCLKRGNHQFPPC